MASDQQHRPSQLFMVRLWAEELGDDQEEYRGKVQHVVSGEARHFREWTTLEAFLLEKLKTPERPLQTNIGKEENHGKPTSSERHKREHRL